MSDTPRDPWFVLGTRTPARIALGRTGASLPTREVLSFALAHAQARDAVHTQLDEALLAVKLEALGVTTIAVESEATTRALYLHRPDLGRRLASCGRERLRKSVAPCDLALVIGDGLSATAVSAHAPALVEAFLPHVGRLGLKLGTVVLAQGARVAIADEVGAILGARLVVCLIGERPGLSAADSLGVYVTYDPRPGRNDAERNCISNVRPGGLSPAQAGHNLAWLVEAALARMITGVALKDGSDMPHSGLDMISASGTDTRAFDETG